MLSTPPIVVFDGDGRMIAAVPRPASRPSGKQIMRWLPPPVARFESWILAYPVNIGKTEDGISAGLVQHDSVIPAVLTEDAMWIRVQLLEGEHWKHRIMQDP
jgi:hypothetical protein